jgi:hypothetical protein
MSVSTVPTSADASAKRSSRRSFSHRKSALHTPTMPYARKALQAAGTCT